MYVYSIIGLLFGGLPELGARRGRLQLQLSGTYRY
jgi:hypothetical protein